MGLQTRINVKGLNLPRMDRNEVIVSGYFAPLVAEFAPNVGLSEENTPVFGFDGTIDTRILQNGTLGLTGYSHEAMRNIIDVLQGINPGQAGLRAYRVDNVANANVIRLTKHSKKPYYIAADFFGGWDTIIKPVEGGPKDAGRYTLDGPCDLPISFRVKNPDEFFVAITADVAAMTAGSGTLASITAPTAIPEEIESLGGMYALAVEAQKRDASTNKILRAAFLEVTADMVADDDAVTLTVDDLNGTTFDDLTDVTHVHAYVLQYGAAPAAGTKKLLGDGIDLRGRWDSAS